MDKYRLTKNGKNHQNSSFNDYAKYSGLAFQMVIVIAITVWGGVKLDELAKTKPLFTIILSLFGVFTAIYAALKDFIKK